MPVTYRFDANIVVLEMVGEYSMDEVRQTILNSISDPKFPANTCLLIDLSESQSIYKRSTEEVKAMAQYIASLGERFNNRIALVAHSDLPYGLMRMSSVGSEERGVKSAVFRTVAEARKWLVA